MRSPSHSIMYPHAITSACLGLKTYVEFKRSPPRLEKLVRALHWGMMTAVLIHWFRHVRWRTCTWTYQHIHTSIHWYSDTLIHWYNVTSICSHDLIHGYLIHWHIVLTHAHTRIHWWTNALAEHFLWTTEHVLCTTERIVRFIDTH